MKLKRIFVPASLMVVLLVQFLPGVAMFTSPVSAAAISHPAELTVSATDTLAYDFVANYCQATWTSGAGTLPCPGTAGSSSGYVLQVSSPQLENGSIDTAPGLAIAPQAVAGGYIQGVYPAYTVQSGDRFQSIVNCAYGASACYVLYRLDYKIGTGAQQTFWHWKERNEGLFYRANLDLSSLAGQSVQFILYLADVPGLGSPTGDQALWGGAQIVHSTTSTPTYPPITSYCDRGTFIGDVTIPDGTNLLAGTAFTKTFRIRNVGTCTWTTSYAMVFVAGSLLGAPSTVIPLTSTVYPGQTMDFSIPMVAPTVSGHYRSYWRFRNASGQQFGLGSGMVTFFADINVSGTPVGGTTITADNPDPSMPGQAVAVSVKVTGSGVTPTGTVAITGADTNCTVTLSGGTGTCNVVFNSLGSKTLTATYSGDGNYGTSSDTESHTVSNISASSTSINSETPDPSTPGTLVQVNVTVTGSGSTPTGTVSITGADSNCTLTLSGGSGSCTVIFNTSGSKTITATYNGDSSYAGSTATKSHTVSTGSTASTTTIVSEAPDPSIVGQAVAVTVTVGGSGTSPTGTVTITGADNNCSFNLSSANSCPVTFYSQGSKTLTAVYSGDGTYSSSSATQSHTVNKSTPSITITSVTPEPSNPGQAVLISFNVTGAGAIPTGTVNVSGPSVLPCNSTLSGGSGSCNVVFTAISGSTLTTATYSGDSNYLSVFATVSHVVKNVSTTTFASLVQNPSTLGDTVTLNFQVTGYDTSGPGTVTVTGQDSGCVGAQAVSALTGTGTCNVGFATAGTKVLTATYSGDAISTSSSGSATETVNRAATTTAITVYAPPSPSITNQLVAVTAVVAILGPSTTPPTGTISIIGLSGTHQYTCSVTIDSTMAGTGTCSINFQTAGSYTITATYSGDSNYTGSSGTGGPYVVN